MMERGTHKVLLGYPRGWRFDSSRKITTPPDGNSLAMGCQKATHQLAAGCKTTHVPSKINK